MEGMFVNMSTKAFSRLLLVTTLLTVVATGSVITLPVSAKSKLHQFKLVGGHFFGPGPIVPDTALPVGYLRNIKFNIKTFSGYAKFSNDGSKKGYLSDGKTRINQNIDAGILDIGGGSNPVLLVAVKGGKNKGREYYSLADDYSFVWKVDIALDPGFAEGIINVEDFILTTGLVRIAHSAQTEQGIPGGYDQAGTLMSGQYLAGRVGDFDQDGFMDGVVVAAPRVPLISNMLPGSPVGNQRGFETDIEIPAHLAYELTLHGIAQFEDAVADLLNNSDSDELLRLLEDVQFRVESAQNNLKQALLSDYWLEKNLVKDEQSIRQQLNSLSELNKKSIAAVKENVHEEKSVNTLADEALSKMFLNLHKLINRVQEVNAKTGLALPKRKKAKRKLNA